MILIAPDKYRGTLTASHAATIIAEAMEADCHVLPMADGGEGTAACIAAMEPGFWSMLYDGCYVNAGRREAVLDSASVIGYSPDILKLKPLDRTSEPLGEALSRLFETPAVDTVYLGIGGTAVCDGGEGMLRTLRYRLPEGKRLIGLSDVAVPLLPAAKGGFSTLTFCPQKGYTETDIEKIEARLVRLSQKLGACESPFGGAGGGIGYAVADVLGCECRLGADYILDRAAVPWEKISLIITGEGRYDRQSGLGKVVGALVAEGSRRDIPVVCLAGSVSDEMLKNDNFTVVDLSGYLRDAPLNSDVAARRLHLVSLSLRQLIK